MRIIIPSFEEIKLMPPTITLFKVLEGMGHEVIYITIFPDEYAPNFKGLNLKNAPLFTHNYTLKHNIPLPNIPGLRGIVFRIDNIIKKICARRLSLWLQKNKKEEDLLWVVNEMTPLLGGASFTKKFKDKFIFTIYELHNPIWSTRHIKKAAQNAKVVVVAEYNRAHIQRYFFKLNRTPIILPNKPLDVIQGRNLPIADKSMQAKINQIKDAGKKIIIYMGIIGEERPLEVVIQALHNYKDEYELVLLGRHSTYLDYLNKKYPNSFTYLGFVTPPEHINIASHADIGLLLYVPQGNIGLNALYCAPNKIFEYSGVGLPVITNDIPGLYSFIKSFDCGVSIDFDDEADFDTKMADLKKNYAHYQVGAQKLFKSVNVQEIVEKIINEAK